MPEKMRYYITLLFLNFLIFIFKYFLYLFFNVYYYTLADDFQSLLPLYSLCFGYHRLLLSTLTEDRIFEIQEAVLELIFVLATVLSLYQ